jgi:Na+-driven multidrug efflux pump
VGPFLPRLFTDDAATLREVARILPFVIWMQPLNALVFVWDGIFMGSEEFRFLAGQMLLSGGAAAAVLLLVLPMGWGLQGVWWGIVTLMGVRLLTLSVRYWGARGPGRTGGGEWVTVAGGGGGRAVPLRPFPCAPPLSPPPSPATVEP